MSRGWPPVAGALSLAALVAGCFLGAFPSGVLSTSHFERNLSRWRARRVIGWMYKWMDGWIDGWMDRWMDG